jgi:hypothetical protein
VCQMKTKTQATPLVRASLQHAEAALILAIQVVDDVLDDYHGCALEHPQLVTAVMMFAGNSYQALTIRDGVDAIMDRETAALQ